MSVVYTSRRADLRASLRTSLRKSPRTSVGASLGASLRTANLAAPRCALRFAVLAFAALLILTAAGPAAAEVASLGLAGAYAAQARGVDAPSWNPANLAWSHALGIEILSAQAVARNNSFTLGDYNSYNGAIWTERDKRQILDRIPGSSFSGRFAASVHTPSVAWNGWAVTVENQAAGRGSLPKDFARLLLFGNDPETSFTLNGTQGEGIAWTEFRLSHGREVSTFQWSPLGAGAIPLAFGASIKILQGWAYGEVIQATGGLFTSEEGITGETAVLARTAEGGSGFGLDLGVAARAPSGWDLSASLHNVFSSISWSRRPELREARAVAENVNVDQIDGDTDDLVADTSSTTPIAGFRRSVPAALTLAAARRAGPAMCEVDLRQGFADRAGSSTTPRLSTSASLCPLAWLETRAGLAYGGGEGMLWAGGLGFSLWKVRLDVSASSLGRGSPFSPNGIGAGVSLALDWSKLTR